MRIAPQASLSHKPPFPDKTCCNCAQVLKGAEKFKFNFDWEAGDDTSRDLNPLYNNTHGA